MVTTVSLHVFFIFLLPFPKKAAYETTPHCKLQKNTKLLNCSASPRAARIATFCQEELNSLNFSGFVTWIFSTAMLRSPSTEKSACSTWQSMAKRWKAARWIVFPYPFCLTSLVPRKNDQAGNYSLYFSIRCGFSQLLFRLCQLPQYQSCTLLCLQSLATHQVRYAGCIRSCIEP